MFVPHETVTTSPGTIAKAISDRFNLYFQLDTDLSASIEKQNFNVGVYGCSQKML